MFRYAQIDDNGHLVSDSFLSGEVSFDNMIPIPEDFDLTNKKYNKETKQWEDYTPEPVEEPISQDEINAEILLNQAQIMETQNAQDEVLAEILLNSVQ